MVFYHYTPSTNLASIQAKGLYHFGIAWFTTSEEPEPTVSMAIAFTGVAQGRISLVKKFKLNKFNTVLDLPGRFEEFSTYMNVPLIVKLFDTSKWYFTKNIIKPKDINTYEVLQEDGTWKKVLKETK